MKTTTGGKSAVREKTNVQRGSKKVTLQRKRVKLGLSSQNGLLLGVRMAINFT